MKYAEKKALLPHPDRKNVWVRPDRVYRSADFMEPQQETIEERIREIARAVAVVADNLELPQTADRMRRIANGQ